MTAGGHAAPSSTAEGDRSSSCGRKVRKPSRIVRRKIGWRNLFRRGQAEARLRVAQAGAGHPDDRAGVASPAAVSIAQRYRSSAWWRRARTKWCSCHAATRSSSAASANCCSSTARTEAALQADQLVNNLLAKLVDRPERACRGAFVAWLVLCISAAGCRRADRA